MRDGGKQKITINGTEVKLDFVDEKMMRKSNAPLIFWCYYLQFLVDCMNHSSVKSLDWKTPMEKVHGNPPDISMFLFGFWDPVW